MNSLSNQIRTIKYAPQEDRFDRLEELSNSDVLDDQLILLYLINDRSSSTREQIVDVLINMSSPLAQVGARVAATDPSPLIRDRAAIALGTLGNKYDIFLLKQLLNDEEWNVRSSSALSLGLIGGVTAFKALRQALNRESNGVVRRDIADALSNYGEKAVHHLEQSLSSETDSNARVGMLAALYKLGKRQNLQVLLQFLSDPNDVIRHQAITSISIWDVYRDDLLEVKDALENAFMRENNPGVKDDIAIVMNDALIRINRDD